MAKGVIAGVACIVRRERKASSDITITFTCKRPLLQDETIPYSPQLEVLLFSAGKPFRLL